MCPGNLENVFLLYFRTDRVDFAKITGFTIDIAAKEIIGVLQNLANKANFYINFPSST